MDLLYNFDDCTDMLYDLLLSALALLLLFSSAQLDAAHLTKTVPELSILTCIYIFT
jgi:hypothetical protein